MKKMLILFLFLLKGSIFSQSIVINEVMSSNSNSFYDEEGDASDWIELFNKYNE